MAQESLAEAPAPTLSGVARVLVNAGKLTPRAANDLLKTSRDRRITFTAAALAAGAVKPVELAHTLASALAVPLLDLEAVDANRLPRNILDAKLAAQYKLVVLGKRGSRLFIGTSDPTDQEATERIKFATQMTPEWVLVEKYRSALERNAGVATGCRERRGRRHRKLWEHRPVLTEQSRQATKPAVSVWGGSEVPHRQTID